MKDIRRSARSMMEMAVVVTGESGRTAAGAGRDLSLHGLFVCTTRKLDEGEWCRVAMTHAEGGNTQRVELDGRVARITPGGLGIEFGPLNDGERERLRQLLAAGEVMETR